MNTQLEKFTNTTDAAVGLMLSAYKNPQKKELVIVVINMTDKAENIKLSGLNFSSPKLKTYTTTEVKELKFSEVTAADAITIEGKASQRLLALINK
ncbi:MAG: hypothetical protein HC817_04170 [Saprospiraceae bacterium]|nr:hypothetical protein [Saprospiraceae bacterium]